MLSHLFFNRFFSIKRTGIFSLQITFCLIVFLPLLISPSSLQAQVTEEWARRYNNSTAKGNDQATALATDEQGNIYVTGYSANSNSSTTEYTTVKYDASGNQLWVKIYNTQGDDKAAAIVADKGYVYVMGTSTLIKYTMAGNQVWVANTGENYSFFPRAALSVDEQGNVYVAQITGYYQATYAKYNKEGKLLWERKFEDQNYDLNINGLTIDKQGNLYLTGAGDTSPSSSDDIMTAKIDADGNEVWRKTYGYLPAMYRDDEGYNITVDDLGNVYVTGYVSSDIESNFPSDVVTLKYDASGNQLWVKRYDGSDYDSGRAISVDKQGNVYVSGTYSDGVTTKYQTIKYAPNGKQTWVKSLDEAISVSADTQGTLYALSGSFITKKYTPAGNLLWSKDYTSIGKGEDYAIAMTTDHEGNVYVTGKSADNTEYYTLYDYATVKYDADGNQLWIKSYNGPANGYDQPVAIAVDEPGNVYVTGISFGGSSKPYSYPYEDDYNYDYLTIKYSPEGSQVWVKRYASLNEGIDMATDIEVDILGNVYVTGGSSAVVGANERNYVTIKYDGQGNQLWAKKSTKGYKASALAVDEQGNVYVTGSFEIYTDGVFTIKYDSAGNELWMKSFDGKNNADTAADIAVDAQGNVYITGSSTEINQFYDYVSYFATVKYDSKGNQLWVKYLYKEYSVDPAFIGRVIALDTQGNVYVGGYQGIIKYDTQGNQQWEKQYNGTVIDLAVDAKGSVYITGNGGSFKYDTQGNQLWTQSYNGLPVSIRVDAQNNIYLTGTSEGNGTFKDFLTIKYNQQNEQANCTASGSILQEVWLHVAGSIISDIPVNTPPTSSKQLSSFEASSNAGNNYGQRIRGYICAPTTGNYTFYISGDDRCELWLSTTDDPATKTKIAAVPYYTSPRQWTKYPAQKSASISLMAGKTYYIEALHKEGSYADNLAVGWIKPNATSIEVIPGAVLSPAAPVGSGTISLEKWDTIEGWSISAIPLTTPPSSTKELVSFQTPTNAGTNYGQRIRGYVHPQVSGNYSFYIAGDDNCELYLSSEEDPAKKIRIAYITGRGSYAAERQWNKFLSQKSLPVYLKAGRKYYIEALHKESVYADNLAVGWIPPTQTQISVISGNFLSPYATDVNIARKRAADPETASAQAISVYPNPFDSRLTILHSQPGSLSISLTDNLGRVVYQVTRQASGSQTELDLSGVPMKAGIYFLRVASQSGEINSFKIYRQ